MNGEFTINGKPASLSFKSDDVLLDILRDAGFTEVKEGCGTGECGACAVLLDGKLVNSCQVLAASAVGGDIITSKGLGGIHDPNIIHKAFVDAGAVQCGFCTPGKIVATSHLLSKNSDPTDDEIMHYMDGHLCRCTGYVKVLDAVRLAARRIKKNGI